jgi:hypothetical protein
VRRLSRELVEGAVTFSVRSPEAEEEKAVSAILAALETRAVARVAMSTARAKGRERLQRAMASVHTVVKQARDERAEEAKLTKLGWHELNDPTLIKALHGVASGLRPASPEEEPSPPREPTPPAPAPPPPPPPQPPVRAATPPTKINRKLPPPPPQPKKAVVVSEPTTPPLPRAPTPPPQQFGLEEAGAFLVRGLELLRGASELHHVLDSTVDLDDA